MKAVIYARYSPRPGEECLSIEKQVERCKAYCVAAGYQLTHIFWDTAASGKSTENRPYLEQALNVACIQKAGLIVYDLSRLTRNTKDALTIVDRLYSAGANLAMINLNIDTATPYGRFFYTMAAAFNELEREQTSKRTSDAMRLYQSQGRRMSFIAPYGWQIDPADPSRMIPHPEERIVIGTIVHLRGMGKKYRQIARELNESKLLCRRSPWQHKTIKKILEREQEARLGGNLT